MFFQKLKLNTLKSILLDLHQKHSLNIDLNQLKTKDSIVQYLNTLNVKNIQMNYLDDSIMDLTKIELIELCENYHDFKFKKTFHKYDLLKFLFSKIPSFKSFQYLFFINDKELSTIYLNYYKDDSKKLNKNQLIKSILKKNFIQNEFSPFSLNLIFN